MHISSLSSLVCPKHRLQLELSEGEQEQGSVRSGRLACPAGCHFPIREGLPHLLPPDALGDTEESVRGEYDRVAVDIYDNAIDWLFAAHREDEDTVREGMVNLLELTPEMNVLEVGCGTGRDSYRIARRLDERGRLHMQDLSAPMVRECVRRIESHREPQGLSCELSHSVSSATALPFPSHHFDAVFHFGGFNVFGDLRAAAEELTRVVKPGGRVVFGDESVAPWLRGTELEGVVTTNNALFAAKAPIDVLPVSARDVCLRWVIANCFYIVSFVKGDGPPELDLDLPHQGWRGGTMRSRYFGRLEGVHPETKLMVQEAAARAGMSVHDWLDRVLRTQAKSTMSEQPGGAALGSGDSAPPRVN